MASPWWELYYICQTLVSSLEEGLGMDYKAVKAAPEAMYMLARDHQLNDTARFCTNGSPSAVRKFLQAVN